MEASSLTIGIVVVLAIVFIIFLIARNAKDEKDINPPLTDELEKQKES